MARRFRTLLLQGSLLAAAVMAAIATQALAAKRDNSIRVASYQQADIIDPYFNTSLITTILAHHIWDTLVYRDPNTGGFRGGLAVSWRRLDDRTIEFKLRQGVRFHNGAVFDADDVVATLDFVTKAENKVIRRAETGWIDHAEKIDAGTVRLVTKQPFPAAFELLATNIFIYPHEYYPKAGPLGMTEKPVGTGPFRVVEHARGKFIRMERNPDYFKDGPKSQPKVAKLELRFIPD